MHRLRRLCQWMLRRRYPIVLVGLGLLLASPSLWVGLQLDDITIRTIIVGPRPAADLLVNRWEPFTFLDGNPERARTLMDLGILPWWTDPDCLIAFMRPLTAVTHVLDFRVWPGMPMLMHAQSLAWFGLLIWAAALLYRRLMRGAAPGWVAVLAALLFAVDDAHAMPAGWLANRNELLAGLFGVLALIAHDRWRRDGWRGGAVLAPLALLAALLAKESAVSVGGYLLAYAIFLDCGRWTARLGSLLPCLLVGVVWYAVYKALGFGVSGSGVYVDPAHDPIGFLRHVVSYGPILLLGQWGVPLSDITSLWSAGAYLIHWVWAVVFLGLVLVLLAPLVARDALARFWALGMMLSLPAACLAFPMDRLLMFVGLGAMGLLAQWLGGLAERSSWVPQAGPWRRLASVLCPVLVGVHLVVAPLLLAVMVNLPKALGSLAGPLWGTFPADPQLREQTVVTVSPASLADDHIRNQLRHFEGQPVPGHSLTLSSSCSAVSLRRTDDRTLVVRPRDGYLPPPGRSPDGGRWSPVLSPFYVARLLDHLVRGRGKPLKLGEVIALPTVTIQFTELTEGGWPAEAEFRFSMPLEDPSLRWFRVGREGYLPFQPPAIGETVEVPMPGS